MHNLLQSFILSCVQGLTEFLPISSAAHLILIPKLLGWADQGLAFDVSVHVGTLIAVIVYFRRELYSMTVDFSMSLLGNKQTNNSRLVWLLALASIPVGVVGFFGKSIFEHNLRSEMVIAIATMVFAIFLGLASYCGRCNRNEYTLKWYDVLIIGCAQILALIPGTSRSGITITAGLMIGLTREAAARFSFLLSIPVIIAAGGLECVELIKLGPNVEWGNIGFATISAAIVAYTTIHFFLKLVEKIGMLPFVIYRLLLGLFLLSTQMTLWG